MTDIARLGYSVDTAGLVKARKELQGLKQDAKRATDEMTNIGRRGKNASDGLANAGRQADAASKSFRGTDAAAVGLGSRLSSLRGAFAGVGAVAVAQQFITSADSFKTFNALLRTVTETTQEFNTAQTELIAIAERTRSPLDATAKLYVRIAPALKDAGVSQGEVLSLIETTNEAIKISGGSAQENLSALQQFAQALGQGVLNGDELKSILENAPSLAFQIAKGLEVPVGLLKKMGEDGELTSEIIIKALRKQQGEIATLFKELPVLSGQAWTLVRNEAVLAIGAIDQQFGIANRWSDLLVGLSQNIGGYAQQFIGFIVGMESAWTNINRALFGSIGSLDAAVAGVGARTNTFFREIGDLLIVIGDALGPLQGPLADFAISLAAIGATGKAVSIAIAAITGIVGLAASINPVVLALAGIATAGIAIYENWDGFTQFWSTIWDGALNVVDAFAKFFSRVFEKMQEVADAFVSRFSNQIETLRQKIEIIVNLFSDVANKVGDVGRNTIVKLGNGMSKGLDGLAGVVGKVSETITDTLNDTLPDLGGTGQDVAKDFTDGWINQLERDSERSKKSGAVFGYSAYQGAKEAIDARSPSKLMESLGIDFAAGFQNGIAKGGLAVVAEAERTAEKASEQFRTVIKNLERQYIALTEGEEAARRFELSLRDFSKSQVDAIVSGERHVQQLEEQRRVTERSERAFESMRESLTAQIIKLTEGDEAYRRYLLAQRGFKGEALETAIVLQNQANALEQYQERVDGFADAVANSITNADSARDVLRNIENSAKSWLRSMVSDFARNQIKAVFAIDNSNGGLSAITNASNSTIERIKQGWGNLTEFFGGIGGKISNIFGDSFDGIISKITGFVSNGVGGIKGLFSGLFGGAGAGVGSLDAATNFAAGGANGNTGALFSTAAANPYLAAAAGGAVLLSEATKNFEDFSDSGKRAALVLSSIAPGIGLAAAAIGGEKLFGGQERRTDVGFRVGFSDGQLSTEDFEVLSRRRSLFRGTARRENALDLSQRTDRSTRSGIEEGRILRAAAERDVAIRQYFDDLQEGVTKAATNLGVVGAEEIFNSFELAIEEFKGKDAQAELQEWLEESTRSAYSLAFDRLGPELQNIVQQNVNLINGPVEEIGQVFAELALIAGTVVPQMRDLGFALSNDLDNGISQAYLLVEALGGVEDATRLLTVYQNEFAESYDVAAAQTQRSRQELDEWNSSIGLAGNATIDTRAEMVRFISTLDQNTESGRAATAVALQQLDAIIQVENANIRQTQALESVAQAARNLNLNFDETSPTALSAADALIELMGGLQQFQSATQSYYNDFFTLEERQQMSLRDATAAVINFNQELGLTGDATIDTADEFRNYVSSLDLQTEAGQRAYVQALELSSSMKLFTDEGQSLEGVIKSLPEKLQESLWNMQNSVGGLADAANDAGFQIEDAANRINNTWTQENANRNAQLNTARFLDNTPGAITADSVAGYQRSLMFTGGGGNTSFDELSPIAQQIANYIRQNDPSAQQLADFVNRLRNVVSAQGGYERVAYDGQLISAHRDEMVLPARVADWVRDASNEGRGNQDELVGIREELRKLREETRSGNVTNAAGLQAVVATNREQTQEVQRNNKDQDRTNRRIAKAIELSAA